MRKCIVYYYSIQTFGVSNIILKEMNTFIHLEMNKIK